MGSYSNSILIGVFFAFQKKENRSVFFFFKFKIIKKIFEKKKKNKNKTNKQTWDHGVRKANSTNFG